jgi:hypothetical protein
MKRSQTNTSIEMRETDEAQFHEQNVWRDWAMLRCGLGCAARTAASIQSRAPIREDDLTIQSGGAK